MSDKKFSWKRAIDKKPTVTKTRRQSAPPASITSHMEKLHEEKRAAQSESIASKYAEENERIADLIQEAFLVSQEEVEV